MYINFCQEDDILIMFLKPQIHQRCVGICAKAPGVGVSTVKQTDIITLDTAIARLRQRWWVARKFLQWHKQKFSSIRRTNLEHNTRKERERQWCVRINSVALSTYKMLCAHTRLTLNNIRDGLKWGCTSQFPRKMGIKNIKKNRKVVEHGRI